VFANLDPRQRRMAIAGVIAGIASLIVLLSRRGASAEPPANLDTETVAVTDPYFDSAMQTGAPPFDYGGANDAFAGQLSTAVTDALGALQREVDEAELGAFPKLTANMRARRARDRERIRRLEHKIDQMQGQGGNRRGRGRRGRPKPPGARPDRLPGQAGTPGKAPR
jgi:hypothetical protein